MRVFTFSNLIITDGPMIGQTNDRTKPPLYEYVLDAGPGKLTIAHPSQTLAIAHPSWKLTIAHPSRTLAIAHPSLKLTITMGKKKPYTAFFDAFDRLDFNENIKNW